MAVQNQNKAQSGGRNVQPGRNNSQPQQIDLLRLAKALWKKAWLIILVGLIFAGATFGYTKFFITPTYQASAMLYVNNSVSLGSTKLSISTGDLTASTSLVDRYSVIVKSRPTINSIIQETGVPYTYEQLSKMITVTDVNDTEFFKITVTDADPEEAKLIANAMADALPDRIESIMDGCSARVVENAVTPTEINYPSVKKFTIEGGLVGVLLICLILVARFLANDQIELEEDIAEVTDLPVLAVIPELTSSKNAAGYYGGYDKGRR